MFPTGTIVTTITTDRIRRAGRLATRRAILGLRRYARWYARVNERPAEPRTAAH
jgi:hypothetical protein